MSQEREGIGPHAMWGYTPAQDLLQNSPLKGQVGRISWRDSTRSPKRSLDGAQPKQWKDSPYHVAVPCAYPVSAHAAGLSLCALTSCLQANVLICQPGDIGHVLRTLGTRRRHPQHTIHVSIPPSAVLIEDSASHPRCCSSTCFQYLL